VCVSDSVCGVCVSDSVCGVCVCVCVSTCIVSKNGNILLNFCIPYSFLDKSMSNERKFA